MQHLKACLAAILCLVVLGCGDSAVPEATLPVVALELVSSDFGSAEGIAFNGEGRLFVVADGALWEVATDGTTSMVVALESPVGIAGIGARDILLGEFGATSNVGSLNDGSVLRITPEGGVSTVATGIPDPNFIHVRRDGSLLVSDDFADLIYGVDPSNGTVSTFLQGIPSPNGLVESLDGANLFVAQTFETLSPLLVSNKVWRVPLDNGQPGQPVLMTEVDGSGANDGVALDERGRVYVAANIDGKIWRIDPSTGDAELAADNVLGVASLAFGEGEFNQTSLYATQLFGGKVWEIPLGVRGAPQNR